jgi:hypothetical protein
LGNGGDAQTRYVNGLLHDEALENFIKQKHPKNLEKKIHWIPDGKKKDTSTAQYVTLQK